MTTSTTTLSGYVRDGREYFPIGRVESGVCLAGWTDRTGRQYDAHFRLVCEECGFASGEERGRVTTDTSGHTHCRDCRAGVPV